ncbi:hypothetical protein SAMN05421736_101486 [Evansella caseinilytica]|uniref:Uncharacterized protein n=1 Tax=Evansella caseinilytica TaxID=1503961 RepID=A0A1H3HFY6_9BACI|nr:hypothetical protein [Evansella caseinilytica]SDY14367.1 hypothetical protein SAMN05421736_101486 [Evansella caseinilytica]
MKIKHVILFGVIALIGAGCGADDSVDNNGNTTGAEVEVDVLSGQPNPAWDLTEEEAEEIAQLIAPLLEQLPEEGADGTSADGPLGFRGFIVRDLPLPDMDDYEQMTVLPGQIIIEKDGGESLTTLDTTGVYQALRTLAKQHVSEEIFEAIPE